MSSFINKFSDKRWYTIFAGVFFLSVFTYILLRAFINEPIHDEISTYLYFIYRGDFYGENIVWDANNHLLNSWLGHAVYPLVKDNFGWLRIFNVLAFVAYFWSVFHLVWKFEKTLLRYLGLIALNCVPFILDYFSYTRGYGLSMGFFLLALVQLQKQTSGLLLKGFLFAYLFLILAVSANLNFINTSLLIVAWIVFLQIIRKNELKFKEHVFLVLAHVSFLVLLVPFVEFAFALKEKGALYYGSLDGLWEVTGKTLSRFTLFYDADWLKWALLLVLLSLIAWVLFRLKNVGLREGTKQRSVLYAYLLAGNLLGILFLAYVLKVNYPEDRTGMYLIPLFLLLLLESIQKVPWLGLVFLYFPITFVGKLNLHTSIFSPDDRMTNAFYQDVKKEIRPEYSIMTYGLMTMNFPLHESHEKVKSSLAMHYNVNAGITDIIVTRSNVNKNPYLKKYYTQIASDKPSMMLAFKRKIPLVKDTLYRTETPAQVSNGEFLPLFELDSLQQYNKGATQVSLKGHIRSEDPKTAIHLVISTTNKKGEPSAYETHFFELVYQGQQLDDDFWHHFVLEKIDPNDEVLKVYVWNRKGETIHVSPVEVSVLHVYNPK